MTDTKPTLWATAEELVEAFEEFIKGFKSKEESNPVSTKKETHIGFVLDSSGSMSLCRDATIEGFNASIEATKKDAHLGGDVYLSLVTFGEYGDAFSENFHYVTNGVVKTKYTHQPVDKLEPLTVATYHPQGSTPMYDGILAMIKALEPYDTGEGDIAFLVNIFTDGQENASTTTGPELSKKITELQNKGNWTFTVKGANIDLNELANVVGIMRSNMSSYVPTQAGTAQAHAHYAASSENYLRSRAAGASASDGFYNSEPTTTVSPVPNTAGSAPVPPFPTPTGKKSKKWEDIDKEEDDDNSLL
jgi:uncharacterized protein YegL